MVPRAFRRLAPALLAALLAVPPAAADVVTTRDGLVLEGTAREGAGGVVTVVTDAGPVVLEAGRVASIQRGEGPRTALRREMWAAAPGDADALFRIALRAEAQGLSDVAREAYEAVVALRPDHAAARRALGYEKVDGVWMTSAQARRKGGLVLWDGAWVLPLEAEAAARDAKPLALSDASLPEAMRTAARGEPALARAATLRLARTEPKERVASATALLLDPDPKVRAWACGHLGEAGDEAALRPLLVSAVRDKDPEVRRAAVLGAAAFGHDDVAVPFVKALASEHPSIVANAARALALLGDPRAVVYIVKRITSHGPSARSYVEFLKKVSYVRDYDVEIAQAANIANPVVGVVQEGVVLDAHVLDLAMQSTVVETVLVDAFDALTGAAAKDEGQVLAWYSAHADSLPRFPKDPVRERAPARASH